MPKWQAILLLVTNPPLNARASLRGAASRKDACDRSLSEAVLDWLVSKKHLAAKDRENDSAIKLAIELLSICQREERCIVTQSWPSLRPISVLRHNEQGGTGKGDTAGCVASRWR